jgi:two-component system, OmpR family, phosphate regulon sensor histidine kinase PhoR
MKKTFPVIVILITLSLLGLFIIQSSWLNNLLEIRNTEFKSKVDNVAVRVANQLNGSAKSTQSLRLPKRGGLTFNSDFHLHVLKPPTIDQRFSVQDIHKMIRRELDSEGVRDINFEFAIVSPTEDIEMSTRNFSKEYWDTIVNRRHYMPIIPESGSDFEGISSVESIIIVVPDFKKQVWASLKWELIGAAVFMLIIIAAFYVTIRSLLNQKKLSEIKSDFINNMTHEFKTPLATISLAVDAIRNEKVQADPTKMKYFSGIIKEENIRMNKHVETILQAALMEKQELKLNIEPLHIHEVIQHALDNHQLQLQDKEGVVELYLNAANDIIEGDDVHFTNMVSNLIDNAIKYSKDKPVIRITTHSTAKSILIRVEDNGIGMNKESLKRIFEKFYRAHTGNLHNVKGFGLGMSYVKTVIDAHKGKIKVDSTLGKGSSFTLEVSLKKG